MYGLKPVPFRGQGQCRQSPIVEPVPLIDLIGTAEELAEKYLIQGFVVVRALAGAEAHVLFATICGPAEAVPWLQDAFL